MRHSLIFLPPAMASPSSQCNRVFRALGNGSMAKFGRSAGGAFRRPPTQTALPMTVVERLDSRGAVKAVNAVSMGRIRHRSSGTRSSSAMIWLMIVFDP